MKIELLKELLGNKIYQCTQENFEKGYNPIVDLIDELEGMTFESRREEQEYYGIYSDEWIDDAVEEYYNKILNKLLVDISNIEKWRSNFSEQSINQFKRWFFTKFNDVEYLPADINLHYYWSNRFTQRLMDLALEHLKGDYSIHYYGGGFTNFEKVVSYLLVIAKTPIVKGLISMNEIERAIIKENQNIVEQLICEIETNCAESTCIHKISEAEEFKLEEWHEDNKWDEQE